MLPALSCFVRHPIPQVIDILNTVADADARINKTDKPVNAHKIFPYEGVRSAAPQIPKPSP